MAAMQSGIARGIFSNEAGLGSAPIAAAAAQTKEPVRQGLVSMTGTFIDTILICTMTGLSIVISGTMGYGTGRSCRNNKSLPDGNAIPTNRSIIYLNDVSRIFCVYYHPWMELLRRTMPGIPDQRKNESRYGIPLSVHYRSIHRTIYDGRSSMEDRRYLQCPDGTAKPDRPGGIKPGSNCRNKSILCQDKSNRIRKKTKNRFPKGDRFFLGYTEEREAPLDKPVL